jgi:hypothetical protein
MATLLAVDTGLKLGLALYGDDGRLRLYRSQHLGSIASLRRAVRGVLAERPDLGWLVLEGGGTPADVWEREAERRGIAVRRVAAETWREQLLYPREHSDGRRAKRTADGLARRVIEWSGARRPTALRHDAAEAILIGLWGVLDIGWLRALPAVLQP